MIWNLHRVDIVRFAFTKTHKNSFPHEAWSKWGLPAHKRACHHAAVSCNMASDDQHVESHVRAESVTCVGRSKDHCMHQSTGLTITQCEKLTDKRNNALTQQVKQVEGKSAWLFSRGFHAFITRNRPKISRGIHVSWYSCIVSILNPEWRPDDHQVLKGGSVVSQEGPQPTDEQWGDRKKKNDVYKIL